MAPKYIKPFVRNLGDQLPDVLGDCKSGGSASPTPGCFIGPAPTSPPGNCKSGFGQFGGACNGGSNASGACSQTGVLADGAQCSGPGGFVTKK